MRLVLFLDGSNFNVVNIRSQIKKDIPEKNNIGKIKTKDLDLIFCTLGN